MANLTEGALERMMQNETVTGAVLQVTGMKRIENSQQGTPRFRLTLNDGRFTTSTALLSTQKNEAAVNGELDLYCIIEVLEFFCNTIQGRRLIMLLDFNVIQAGLIIQREIGNPRPLDLSALKDANNGGAAANGATGQGRQPVTSQAFAQDPPPSAARGQFPATGQRPVSVAQQHQPAGNGASANPAPITVLLGQMSPYRSKWCIRVRVTKKYEIRTYRNSRGEGKFFSVDLSDESGEMRATGFNEECDKFYDLLKEGAVYFIKGGTIKAANRQYTSINNAYEITFSRDTQIDPCFDDNVFQLPSVTFNFVKLDKLEAAPRDRVIDVIGVVDSSGTCQTIVARKTSQELKKRDIRIVDDSQTSVALTLWGTQAETFEADGHPVVAVKGVRISDFNGLSLATTAGSQFHTNPDVPESHRLRGWYDSKGQDAEMKNLSAGGSGPGGGAGNFMPIALAEAIRLGTGDKADYYSVKGFISHIRRDNCLYKACSLEECNKKVIDQGTGRYRCERCNKEQDTFKWRMMLQVSINDFSGTQPITIFNEQGEHLMGMSARDLADLRDMNESEFNATMDKLLFTQYAFRLRAKMDLYNDEMRMKVMCQKVDELNVNDYTKFLTDEIKKMEALPDSF